MFCHLLGWPATGVIEGHLSEAVKLSPNWSTWSTEMQCPLRPRLGPSSYHLSNTRFGVSFSGQSLFLGLGKVAEAESVHPRRLRTLGLFSPSVYHWRKASSVRVLCIQATVVVNTPNSSPVFHSMYKKSRTVCILGFDIFIVYPAACPLKAR